MEFPASLFPRPALAPEEVELLRQVEQASGAFAARAAGYDASRAFPWENIERINALGLNGMFLPEEVGGYPLSYTAYLACLTAISGACASTGLIWATNFHAMSPVADWGTAEQKQRFLRPVAQGALASLAITEANSGSSATGMLTRFRPDGDDIVIDGEKVFITSGDVSSVFLVFGKWTELGDGKDAISALVVEKGASGFEVVRRERTMGHRASHTTALAFRGCRVPRGNLLGRPGDGVRVLLAALNRSRPSVAAHALAIARAALSDLVDHARQRVVGGKRLIEHQGNRFTVAELAADIAMCEAMLWNVAARVGAGATDIGLASAALKLRAGDLAVRAAMEAIQIQGGYGYLEDNRAERLLRDAKLMQIGEGAAEALKDFIGGAFMTDRAAKREAAA